MEEYQHKRDRNDDYPKPERKKKMGLDIKLNIDLGTIIGAIMSGLVAIFLIFAVTRCSMEESGFGGNENALDECFDQCEYSFDYNDPTQKCFDMCTNFYDKHPEMINYPNSPENTNATLNIIEWTKEGFD